MLLELVSPDILPLALDSAALSTVEDGLSKKEKNRLAKCERKAQKQLEKRLTAVPVPAVESFFLPRQWRTLPVAEDAEADEGKRKERISIMSWNMLAQALVRRELFPNSDFLRVKDRIPTLMKEVLHVNADIIALQEVDRLEDHLPSLTLSYSYSYHIGYSDKPHGLLIAWKSSLFDQVGELSGRFDDLPIVDPSPLACSSSPLLSQEVSPPTVETRKARGLSRVTRNVFLITALKFKDREGGIIIGTTHLFWHPTASYERARQTGILFREAKKFRDLGGEGKWRDWEVVLAGDFNTQPNELAYSLLTSHSITAPQIEALEISTVVHMSVDKIYDPTFRSIPSPEEAEGGKHTDPDKVIKNARQGTDSDGLLDLEGFKALYDYSLCKAGACSCSLTGPSTTIPDSRNEVTSAYGSISHLLPAFDLNMYVDRTPEVHSTSGWNIPEKAEVVKARREAACLRKGDYEPKWTNFTPLWRCTLDYIFLLPRSVLATSIQPPSKFIGLLEMHTTEQMGGGLPKKFVGASDHESLGAILELS